MRKPIHTPSPLPPSFSITAGSARKAAPGLAVFYAGGDEAGEARHLFWFVRIEAKGMGVAPVTVTPRHYNPCGVLPELALSHKQLHDCNRRTAKSEYALMQRLLFLFLIVLLGAATPLSAAPAAHCAMAGECCADHTAACLPMVHACHGCTISSLPAALDLSHLRSLQTAHLAAIVRAIPSAVIGPEPPPPR